MVQWRCSIGEHNRGGLIMAQNIRYDIAKVAQNGQIYDWEYPTNFQDGVTMAKKLSMDSRWLEIYLAKEILDENGDPDVREWTRIYRNGKLYNTQPF